MAKTYDGGADSPPATDILLVEDNDDDAFLIERKISQGAELDFVSEITTTRADSLTTALEQCQQAAFDTVFLDLGLPESRGIDTLDRFLDAEPDIPIIVLTGLNDSQTSLDAIQRGAQDYLVKGDLTPKAIVRTMQYGIERKKNEELLRRQRNQIEFFNSILRHDMLNGLNVIMGQSEVLAAELDGDEAERIETILKWTENIVDLTEKTRDILDTLAEGGGSELRAVDVNTILQDEAGDIEGMREGVSVEVVSPANVHVLANDLFADVVRNLLMNAVEHTRPDPVSISIAVERIDRNIRLVIEDDGPGVPDDLKRRVFERGKKGKASVGTGFGLYFVASMVESYNGDVWVEDNDPKGARFIVELQSAD